MFSKFYCESNHTWTFKFGFSFHGPRNSRKIDNVAVTHDAKGNTSETT